MVDVRRELNVLEDFPRIRHVSDADVASFDRRLNQATGAPLDPAHPEAH
ncbi:MAG: hypothetical protein VKK05_07650 [Synechococcus sp.]|nr:hypothetical protein [Synechococcus sp.]